MRKINHESGELKYKMDIFSDKYDLDFIKEFFESIGYKCYIDHFSYSISKLTISWK